MNYLQIAGMVAVVVAAGAWRWFDGSSGHLFGVHIRTTYRNIVTGGLAASAAVLGIGPYWWAAWAAAIATLSIAVGRTKWEDPLYQFFRFALPAALIVAPYIIIIYWLAWKLNGSWSIALVLHTAWFTATDWWLGVLYPFLCGAAGASYSFIKEDKARVVLGATVIGGLVIL
jgi:hypothetical protein